MQVEKDRRPVTTQLVQQIRRLMTETGLKPGDRVPPQRELAQRLGASRPTVREAVAATGRDGADPDRARPRGLCR